MTGHVWVKFFLLKDILKSWVLVLDFGFIRGLPLMLFWFDQNYFIISTTIIKYETRQRLNCSYRGWPTASEMGSSSWPSEALLQEIEKGEAHVYSQVQENATGFVQGAAHHQQQIFRWVCEIESLPGQRYPSELTRCYADRSDRIHPVGQRVTAELRCNRGRWRWSWCWQWLGWALGRYQTKSEPCSDWATAIRFRRRYDCCIINQ